jgi:hypothetical protein
VLYSNHGAALGPDVLRYRVSRFHGLRYGGLAMDCLGLLPCLGLSCDRHARDYLGQLPCHRGAWKGETEADHPEH